MSDSRHTDPEPNSGPRSLREACVKAGLDRGGRRCADCPLKGLCQSQLRWLVKTVREKTYRC
jgi:hypothetical protein